MRMVSTLIDGGRCDVKLKRILCMMLVCLSSMGLFLVPVEAADNINLQAGFIDVYMNGNTRETKPPKTYHNLATSGIYKGEFSSLRATIYTNRYFDMKDGAYYSRVRCYGEYPSLTYTAGNYCISCKKVLSTYDGNYSTPSETWEKGDWESFRHTVGSSHTNHFVCPFVKNTSSSINGQLYAIGGDIWVNYTNSWN